MPRTYKRRKDVTASHGSDSRVGTGGLRTRVRAIILAAGSGSRWNLHTGVPKHFVVVDGEPILLRTIRLLQRNGVLDIWVVGPARDARYRVRGTRLFVPIKKSADYDADKFLNSSSLWLEDGRTIVIYGDTYFSDDALRRIVTHSKREWTLFCRPGPSRVDGRGWGECFAQSFYPTDIPEHRRALKRVVRLVRARVIDRAGGWEHYKSMQRANAKALQSPETPDIGRMVIIDDWTDDFDFPSDYDEFIKRRQWRKGSTA